MSASHADGLTRGATELADRLEAAGPTVVVDADRAWRNLARMAETAAAAAVRLRPHVKTHQSTEVALWLREFGIDAITVSSLAMARRFAAAGWRDITLAFPVNLREAGALAELAAEIDLGLLVSDPLQVAALEHAMAATGARCGVWLKIDCGYGRAGVRWDDRVALTALAESIAPAPGLELRGVLTHAGHSYHARGPEAIRKIHADTLSRMAQPLEVVKPATGSCLVSIGDTPGCSLADDFTGVDEIRPGNFIFHDLMQLDLGVCRPEDLAAGLLCPVVGKRPGENMLVLQGGAVHLSLDRLPERAAGAAGGTDATGGNDATGATGATGAVHFGRAAMIGDGCFGELRPDTAMVSLSQEHGLLQVPPADFAAARIGDMVLVMPVHSCLMCDLHDDLLVI